MGNPSSKKRRNRGRRRVLALFGTLPLSGCLFSTRSPTRDRDNSTTGPREPPKTTSTEESTTTAATTPVERNPISELRGTSVPERVPFRHTVSFVRGQSADHPPAIEIAIVNETDRQPTIQTGVGPLPFPAPRGENEAGDFLYVHGHFETEKGAAGTCWRTDGVGIDGGTDWHTFESGERIDRQYAVLNPMENSECWPTGEYQFSMEYTLNPRDDDNEFSYEWGFTLVVS